MIKSVYEIVNELLVENESELNESFNSTTPSIIKEFIKFCKQEIGFQTHPIVTFTRKKEQTRTLGHNDISNNKIMVYVKDRLLADILRTLAHEFVHTYQKDVNKLSFESGNDGSEQENEANAKAGEIMRKFGKKFPDIYSSKFPVNAYKNTYLDRTTLNESEGVHEYGCLMLKLNIDNWKDVIGKINDDDLYMKEDDGGYGKENNPHVTILYGFIPSTDYSEVERVLSKLKKPIPVIINQLSLFKNEEFDVLKYDVSGKALHSLNKLFSDKFENQNKYPEYKPHCTVAYIIKGQADKYIAPISPLKIYCDEFIYSFPSGEKKTFIINNNE